MSSLESLDLSIFRLIRETLRNPVFDWLMPLLSGKLLFVPALVIGVSLLAWKGGIRGRVCLLVMGLVVLIGDTLVCSSLKQAIGRPRPESAHEAEYKASVEQRSNQSMPSSHAANCFSAAAVAFLYYRRSLRFTLPLALGVSYSRIYKGSHYPSDVLVGALLGILYGFALVWVLDGVWRTAGRRFFPLWWTRVPSIINIGEVSPPAASKVVHELSRKDVTIEQHWLRLGYLAIGVLLLARLLYQASGLIELGIDEAYQWIWSKHLALSYYSKPPLIAYAQRIGTTLWGDTAFGVRFLSPISASVVSLLLLRFLARQGYVRAGFWLVLISATTPLLEVGATVLTVDCLLVLFWTAAMVSGWRAAQEDSLPAWCWTGLWMGLGCLSKYTALFQPICWIIFFILWKPARPHLRKPGPYFALAIMLACTLPIWIWNAQHNWVTLSHVATNARVDRPWNPSLSYFLNFTGAELALLNPVFFVAMFWAVIAACQNLLATRKRSKSASVTASGSVRQLSEEPEQCVQVYLLSMGAPLFLGYWLYTFHSKVQPNWIAASLPPLVCLMAVFWESHYRSGTSSVKGWLTAGLAIGLPMVIAFHDTNLIGKITGHPLSARIDPLRQVRGWPETGRVVGEARAQLLAEGRPVFIICDHYGITGLLSFYMPEAKAGVPDHPLVYFQSSDVPLNQFYFWPGYRDRKGQNAIYVVETTEPHPTPEILLREFARVKDLGMKEVLYRGRLCRRLQLFECRDLQ